MPSHTIATSSGSLPTLVLVTDSRPPPPNDLKRTAGRVLFIALHIMNVRISPAAPTIEPAIIRTLFPITKPVKAAAIPDIEFRRLTTTGMSAPPIGITNSTPSRQDRPTSE